MCYDGNAKGGVCMTLGEMIRSRREAVGLSQQEMAVASMAAMGATVLQFVFGNFSE